jgi:hypothetical protein
VADDKHYQKMIRRIWNQGLAHPAKALWRWARQPEGPPERLRRWRALQEWAKNHKEAAKTAARKATWRVRFRTYRKRAKHLKQWIKKQEEQQPPVGQTGCGNPGAPDWSGGASICEREVVPVSLKAGVPVTSRKRTSTLGNPSSDHYVGNTTAYAVDLGTFNGAGLAHDIARELGISGYSTGNYNGYYISRCSYRFRVQILWAVSGHYNHVHCGVRRA